MPAGIVQLVNHTSRAVHYHNLESGHKIDLEAHRANNEDIPSSVFYDDTIPYRSSGHIEVYFDSAAKVNISDENYHFHIYGPVPYSTRNEESRHDLLANGGQYILRLDEVIIKGQTMCALTILEYENRFRATYGYVDSQSIQQAHPVVTLVLTDIFNHGTMHEGSRWDR